MGKSEKEVMMQAKEHSAYQEEISRLEETKQWIQGQSKKLEIEKEALHKEITQLRKQVSSALDERLVLKEQMQQMTSADLSKMNEVIEAPYFGRINFKENFQEEVEVVYIGKFGLFDSQLGDMMVLDWRTPMANIYYSGIDEDVTYRAPNGLIEGKMLLKRRYVIEQGELIEIHDERSLQDNLKENFEQSTGFLIESLNKSTSGRLKEIVATIQQEQNQIIRSEAFMPLIVQGVAGSGKTTIALHRMAYLIYNQQNPELQYMVVAPNKLFLNYISDILPDLGVENVVQTTFEDWALKRLGKGIKLAKGQDKLDTLLVEDTTLTEVLAVASKLRGSILFQKVINLKLKALEGSIINKSGVKYENTTIIGYKELQQVFLASNTHLSLNERVKLMGSYIKQKLKDKEAFIKRAIEEDYRLRINQLKESVEDIEIVRSEIIALFDERDARIKDIRKWMNVCAKSYVKAIELPKVEDFYLQIFEEEEQLCHWLSDKIEESTLKKVIHLMQRNLASKLIETEDLGPLTYIQMRLYGMDEKQKYAHIVVDEAQDLDEMKLMVLRCVSANDSFTLVGDLAQGIYGYKGINNWERTMERVFSEKKYNYFELTTSYRSTIEIIDLANKVIQKCTSYSPLLAKPVFRHGEKPECIICENEEAHIDKIAEDIRHFQSLGMVSICVITKDMAESKKAYTALKKVGLMLQFIEKEEEQYLGQVVVMPSYLAKGLEFDAVLLYDVSARRFKENDLDIKLLYVMITRALHYLNVYALGEPAEILKSL